MHLRGKLKLNGKGLVHNIGHKQGFSMLHRSVQAFIQSLQGRTKAQKGQLHELKKNYYKEN